MNGLTLERYDRLDGLTVQSLVSGSVTGECVRSCLQLKKQGYSDEVHFRLSSQQVPLLSVQLASALPLASASVRPVA